MISLSTSWRERYEKGNHEAAPQIVFQRYRVDDGIPPPAVESRERRKAKKIGHNHEKAFPLGRDDRYKRPCI